MRLKLHSITEKLLPQIMGYSSHRINLSLHREPPKRNRKKDLCFSRPNTTL
jgi:hypothetical protein